MRFRLTGAAAVVVALAVTPIAPVAPAAARPVAPQVAPPVAPQVVSQVAPQWKQVFATDFNGTALPRQCNVYEGPYGAGDSYWVPDAVKVSGGLLRLGIRRGSMGGKHYLAGGLGCSSVSQVYGRFEWSAKVPVGKGIDSYATLWPVVGDGESHRTLIEIIGVPGREVMAVTNAYGSGFDDKHVPGQYADRFHTYVMEWTPTSFRVTVDGVQKFASTRISTVKKSLQFAVLNGDEFSSLPDAATVLPAEFQVDWVRAYTYTGEGAAAPPSSSPSAAPSPSALAAGPASASASAGSQEPAEAGPVSAAGLTSTGGSRWAWWAVGALAVGFAAAMIRLIRRRRSIVEDPRS
jgi:beta-glucanase (GH16 family)